MNIFSTTIALLLSMSNMAMSATAKESDIPNGTYPKHDTATGNTKEYTFAKDSGFQVYDFATNRVGSSGSVTCTCNSGSGGCNPDESGNCYMTSCDNCSKTTSGVAIRTDGSVKIMESAGEVKENLPSTSKALFDIKMFQESFKTFEKEYGEELIFDDDYCPESKKTGVCNAKKGHAFVAVDVYGSTTYIPAKLKTLQRSRHRNLRIGGSFALASLSCSCNSDGSCPMDSTWGHKYCDAGSCQSCTMSGTSIAQYEQQETVKEKSLFP